jgi:hypothetical protein
LQVSEKELSEVRLPTQKILLYLDKIKSRKSFFYLGLTVIGFTIFGYLGSGSLYIAYIVLIYILLLVGISGIIFFVLYKLINWLYSRKLKRIRDAKRKELKMVELEERIRSAEQTVEKAVFEKGILPELRSLINVLLTPPYDTSLTPLMAPGLAESYTSAYEIPTESKKKLNRLLNIMPNGSIGIAGPRGAGKTTLLLSLCVPLGKGIKGRRVLSVMTSAPVEYEARDFILHIFTLVCKRVLELKGKSPLSPWRYISNLQY